MKINRWWDNFPNEVYWLETTGRGDIGVDLRAPQLDDRDKENHSYAQVLEVKPGDIVLHYDTGQRAIVAWSQATGEVSPVTMIWGGHRPAAKPEYVRAGWSTGLSGPVWLQSPLTLAEIRVWESAVRATKHKLMALTSGSLYFPFELSAKRPLRPKFYLTRFPLDLVSLFPRLSRVAQSGRAGRKKAVARKGRRGTVVQPNLKLRQSIEEGAQDAVEASYRSRSWAIQDVARLNLGWDLEARHGTDLLRIQVKGRSGGAIAAELTPNEYRRVERCDPSLRICVVTDALDRKARQIHEFSFAPATRDWRTSTGMVLEIDVISGARIRA